MQRTSLAISSLFHVGVIAVSYYGLPALRDNTPLVDTPVIVELVSVADITNVAPKPQPKATPAPPKAKPPPPPPPPPPKVVEAPPPPPEPEIKEEVSALPPVPEPKVKPKPKPKIEAKLKPKVKAKPKAPAKLAKIKPRRKPKPPDAFASVLKTLAELDRTAPAPKKKEKKPEPKKDAFELEIAKALASKSNTFDASRPVSISEIDLVRQQITRCWIVPAGAKDAQNLVIDIAVQMNRDGTVQHAELRKGSGRMSDPFYRTAAESALRAVLNPRCQPFKLPAKKFDRWKTMTLSFNPSDIL
jgi:outer membrane biosynthesis protein TonB